MDLTYWRYFLSIDSDLEHALRYVELAEANYSTYSIEFARILLAAGSEIDVLSKVLSSEIDPGTKSENIDQYRSVILSKFPKLPTLQTLIPRYSLGICPWDDWLSAKNPDWWRSYNSVKHRRHSSYAEANLLNTLSAVAGLLSLNLYHYRNSLYEGRLEPWPHLFGLHSRTTIRFLPGPVLLDFDKLGGQ